MPYFLDGNCVHKGTKEDPGEVVKCHETRAEALAHLRALYVHVEDAKESEDKGARGSGWHAPPLGTHAGSGTPGTAAPGDAGPMPYERDSPTKGRLCKCSECGAVVTLPKGKQCQDLECPSCAGSMAQLEPRQDRSAGDEAEEQPHAGRKDVEKAITGEPDPTLHGSGGAVGEVASVLSDDDAGCKCPHCGVAVSCTARICPHCKGQIDRKERGEGDKMDKSEELQLEGVDVAEKSEWSAAAVNDLPDSAFLYVEDGGEKDEEGKTVPRSLRHLPYKNAAGEVDLPHLRNALSRLGQPATGKGWLTPELRKRLQSKAQGVLSEHGGSEKALWTVYKSATGDWRWLALCNWAVVDREAEVVSEKAYRDGILRAKETGHYGELDLVHVKGTDVGECDTLFTVGKGDEPPRLGAGGKWYDTPHAVGARQAVQAESDYWGMSIRFRYDPQRKVKGIYTRNIEYLKYTILPEAMAASYGTAIAVQGGDSMNKALDEKTAEALGKLGYSEDEIADLAQKNKALPLEENVVEKEGAAEEEVVVEAAAPVTKATFWEWVKELGEKLTGSPAQVDAPVASAPEEAGKANEVTDPAKAAEPAENKQAGGEDALRTALAEMAKALGETVRVELAQRDERIVQLEKQLHALDTSIEEKVTERLRDLPKAVHVAASQSQATVDTREQPKGLTFGQRPEVAEKFAQTLVADIQRVVKQEVEGAQYKA